MEARHRIAPNRPLELFPANRSTMPSWESLPANTRRAVLEHDTPSVSLQYAADAQIRSLGKAFEVWLSHRNRVWNRR